MSGRERRDGTGVETELTAQGIPVVVSQTTPASRTVPVSGLFTTGLPRQESKLGDQSVQLPGQLGPTQASLSTQASDLPFSQRPVRVLELKTTITELYPEFDAIKDKAKVTSPPQKHRERHFRDGYIAQDPGTHHRTSGKPQFTEFKGRLYRKAKLPGAKFSQPSVHNKLHVIDEQKERETFFICYKAGVKRFFDSKHQPKVTSVSDDDKQYRVSCDLVEGGRQFSVREAQEDLKQAIEMGTLLNLDEMIFLPRLVGDAVQPDAYYRVVEDEKHPNLYVVFGANGHYGPAEFKRVPGKPVFTPGFCGKLEVKAEDAPSNIPCLVNHLGLPINPDLHRILHSKERLVKRYQLWFKILITPPALLLNLAGFYGSNTDLHREAYTDLIRNIKDLFVAIEKSCLDTDIVYTFAEFLHDINAHLDDQRNEWIAQMKTFRGRGHLYLVHESGYAGDALDREVFGRYRQCQQLFKPLVDEIKKQPRRQNMDHGDHRADGRTSVCSCTSICP